MLFCKFGIVHQDFIIVIIPEFKISPVKHLIFPDMTEQFQVIVVVESTCPFFLVQIQQVIFQLVPDGVGQIIDVGIVGIKGGAVELCTFADI